MKLQVGKNYRRRDGAIVEIVRKSGEAKYPFYSDSGAQYTDAGNYLATGGLSSYDLVEEYSEQKDQEEKTFNIFIDFYDERVWCIDFCESKQLDCFTLRRDEDLLTLITDINGRIHAYRLKDVKSFTISEK